MTRFDTEQIRGYYERHTAAFVRLGQGGALGAMHRAVWGPGVRHRADAFRCVEERIAEVARRLPAPERALHLVDLGCGVGGSLCYLAERLAMTGTGITLSAAQAQLARERIRASRLADRLTIVTGDFVEESHETTPADLVFAIESFVHTPEAARFLARAGARLRPGGALVVCDDFRRPAEGAHAAAAIEQFCRGWRINTLVTREELQALAADAGLEHESSTDLTPFVEIGRVRDRVIDVLAAPLARIPWLWPRLGPWLGGSALQTCLRHRWIGYDLAVFRRRA